MFVSQNIYNEQFSDVSYNFLMRFECVFDSPGRTGQCCCSAVYQTRKSHGTASWAVGSHSEYLQSAWGKKEKEQAKTQVLVLVFQRPVAETRNDFLSGSVIYLPFYFQNYHGFGS